MCHFRTFLFFVVRAATFPMAWSFSCKPTHPWMPSARLDMPQIPFFNRTGIWIQPSGVRSTVLVRRLFRCFTWHHDLRSAELEIQMLRHLAVTFRQSGSVKAAEPCDTTRGQGFQRDDLLVGVTEENISNLWNATYYCSTVEIQWSRRIQGKHRSRINHILEWTRLWFGQA